MKTYDYRRVSKEEMEEKGYEVFNKSRERFHDASLFVSKTQFARRFNNPGLDCWLGFDKGSGQPAAFAFCTLFDGYCDYNTIGISPDFPNSTYPMYGLLYEMNRYYLQERGLHYVCDGIRSITGHSNVQPFLEEKFKFRKAYCDLQVFYKWYIGLCVRMLFPFRRWIKNQKIAAILRQEAWARGVAQ